MRVTFFAGDLDLGVCVGARAEFFVERETDGLNGDVRIAVAFEEGAQDARGNVAAATNGNYEVWLEVIEDLLCCSLAEFVDLVVGDVDLLDHVCDLVNPVVHTRIQNVRIE